MESISKLLEPRWRTEGRQKTEGKTLYRAEEQAFAQILVRSVPTWGHVKGKGLLILIPKPRSRNSAERTRFVNEFLVDAISLCRTIAISGCLLRDLAAGRADDVPLPSTERWSLLWART